MRRHHHRSYYARRRVPGSFTSLYLRAKMIVWVNRYQNNPNRSSSGTPDWTRFLFVSSVASLVVPGKSFAQQRHWTLSLDWIAQVNFNA